MPIRKLARRLMPMRLWWRQAYTKRAPERCVWGSDWPHPGVRDPEPKPDDAVLFDLLLAWAPDENVRHRILVENPAVLYDFPKNA